MKSFFVTLCMVILAGTCSAKSHCDALRDTGATLLPNTTFEIRHASPLNGCFSGYLPEGELVGQGLYQFGVFRDGEEVASLPIVTAGMDLASSPYLKILATSFSDLDHDGRRDVLVIGSTLAAKGELIFVQIYWGCDNTFTYEDKVNAEVNWAITNRYVVNVKSVETIVADKRLKSGC